MLAYRTCPFLVAFSIACLLFAGLASAQERPANTRIHPRTGIPGVNDVTVTIGTFTGGDAGEGLDLRGNFLHAVNFDGDVPDQQVGSANFVHVEKSSARRRDASGVINGELLDGHGGSPNYGDSANDDALEAVMNSVHVAASGAEAGNDFNTIFLDGLTEGTPYKLQLLLTDPQNDVDRAFDIRLHTVNPFPFDAVIDGLSPQQLQGYYGPEAGGVDGQIAGDPNIGVVVTAEWVQPAGTALNIGMDNYGGLPPDYSLPVEGIIAGLTLEAIPEPGSFLLLGMGSLGLLFYRRRR